MTTFEYIKWKERRTRRSKVMRRVNISSLESSEYMSNPLSSEKAVPNPKVESKPKKKNSIMKRCFNFLKRPKRVDDETKYD